jgi:parvulin-like peptidyl-prolyl isomerase
MFSVGLAIVFLLASTGPAAAQEPELVSEIVARINNDIITSADYVQALRDFKEELARQMSGKSDAEINAEYDRLKPTVLDILIEDLLLEQKAKELNIDVESDINQEMLALAKQGGFKDVLAFEEELKKQGVDPEGLRIQVGRRLRRDMVLQREVLAPVFQRITDKERREFYEKNKEGFTVPGEVTLSEIFLPLEGHTATEVEQRARRLVTELRAGEDFIAAVKANSAPTRPSTSRLGKLGSFKQDELNKETAAAVSTLKPGDITEPIRLQDGFQIIRLDERKEPVLRKFEDPEVVRAIGQTITMQKAEQERKKYVKELREQAYIDITKGYQSAEAKAEKSEPKPLKTKN